MQDAERDRSNAKIVLKGKDGEREGEGPYQYNRELVIVV